MRYFILYLIVAFSQWLYSQESNQNSFFNIIEKKCQIKNGFKSYDIKNINKIYKLESLNNDQINNWIIPLINEGGKCKFVSVFRETDSYITILVIRPIELLPEDTTMQSDQFLININKNGKFISGIVVQDNYPLDDDYDIDTITKIHRYPEKVGCIYRNDSIFIYEKADNYLKVKPEPYKTWYDLRLSVYIILKSGYFEPVFKDKEIWNSSITPKVPEIYLGDLKNLDVKIPH